MINITFRDAVTERYEHIGYFCKRWRIANNYTLQDVAEFTGYGKDNIIKFEQGKNNNMTILLWYVIQGFKIENFASEVRRNEVATDS